MKTKLPALIFATLWLFYYPANAQNFEWARSFGGNSGELSEAIALDASGNVYTAGYFQSTVDFDPGTGVSSITAVGNFDVFVQKMDASGNFIWARTFGGVLHDKCFSIAIDASGNVYTTGIFRDTVDFDPGIGVYELVSNGTDDIFIQKMDSAGNFIWARSFGGITTDVANSIAVDTWGNVYTTGHFVDTVDFDPGPGVNNLVSGAGVLSAIFIQKLDASGNFVWAKSFGENDGSGTGSSIALDASGNIYTTGTYIGTLDFDLGPGVSNLVSVAHGQDFFLLKLDSLGDFVWAKSCGGAGSDGGSSVAVDAYGNVYATGIYIGPSDFDPGPGVINLPYLGGTDVFVLKLDAVGNLAWIKYFGGSDYDWGYSLAVDEAGSIYVTGSFADTVDFDPGPGVTNLIALGNYLDVFIQKLDASGSLLWVKSFGRNADEDSKSIAVDASGNIYTTGSFRGTVDFDPGPGVFNMYINGVTDVFVHKMSDITVGMGEGEDAVKASVYPNPTTETVQLTLDKELSDVELVLCDIQGRVIFKQKYTALSNTEIRLPNAKGIYILTIQTQESLSNLRLVKQ